LIWEGKYDAAGRRVAPLRVALPFQTVETVNESAQDRRQPPPDAEIVDAEVSLIPPGTSRDWRVKPKFSGSARRYRGYFPDCLK
jgi:hypothetical protein